MWYKCLFKEGDFTRLTRHAGVLFVGEQRSGFRKAFSRGLEGEISTLGAKREGGLEGGGCKTPKIHRDLQAQGVSKTLDLHGD